MAVAELPPQIESPPAPPPAPKTSISVTPQTVDKGTPPPPVKPGTRREQLFQAFEKKAADNQRQPDAKKPEAPKPEPKAEPKVEPKTEKAEETPAAKEEPAKEKVSPWKLVDQYKNRAAELEKQLADAKTAGVPEEERKVISERIEKAEKRAKELEDEIRYVKYEKSEEFQTKYWDPYVKAYQEAVSELSQIPVTDAEGNKRYATEQDLLGLMSVDLGKAREIADSSFGPFADDVMAHRKDVLKLFKAQEAAKDIARKTGAEREKKMAEETTKAMSERSAAVKQAWDKANQDALAHEKYGKYFTPVEGDQQINDSLSKGFKLVDRSLSENAWDPKLSSEERASIIKRAAAVRNRAAAFGRMVVENQKLEAKVAELLKELEGFKSSEPDTAGSQQQTTQAPTNLSARDRLFADIQKRAK